MKKLLLLALPVAALVCGCDGSEKMTEKPAPAKQEVVMIPTDNFKKGSGADTKVDIKPEATTSSAPSGDQKQPGDR